MAAQCARVVQRLNTAKEEQDGTLGEFREARVARAQGYGVTRAYVQCNECHTWSHYGHRI